MAAASGAVITQFCCMESGFALGDGSLLLEIRWKTTQSSDHFHNVTSETALFAISIRFIEIIVDRMARSSEPAGYEFH